MLFVPALGVFTGRGSCDAQGMLGRHLLGPVPLGKHTPLLFQAFSKENTRCAKLREHQTPQNKHILQVKLGQRGEKQTDIKVMKHHESYISTNSSECTCRVAFVLRDVIKLLWLTAAFIFMDYCVRYVTKLKSQPRFSSGTQAQVYRYCCPGTCPRDRAGVLLDKIHSSLNSRHENQAAAVNQKLWVVPQASGSRRGERLSCAEPAAPPCVGAAAPAGLPLLWAGCCQQEKRATEETQAINLVRPGGLG